MYTLSIFAQLIIAISIAYVWIIRYDNLVVEFKEYGLSNLTRNFVGATKIALSTLLVAGIWYPKLVLIPALLMAGLMLCAQVAHIKVNHPLSKYIPSFILLLLSLFAAWVHFGTTN
ncbi:hypothetical protein ACVWYG_002280 [Pedobacter sp. UYEF25]